MAQVLPTIEQKLKALKDHLKQVQKDLDSANEQRLYAHQVHITATKDRDDARVLFQTSESDVKTARQNYELATDAHAGHQVLAARLTGDIVSLESK